MASISVAVILQTLYPGSLFWGIPVAGCAGLAFGWTVAYPAVRLLVRRFRDTPGEIASAAAIGLSLLLSVPACLCAPSIGLGGFVAVILFVGMMAGIGGLFWGGYLVDEVYR